MIFLPCVTVVSINTVNDPVKPTMSPSFGDAVRVAKENDLVDRIHDGRPQVAGNGIFEAGDSHRILNAEKRVNRVALWLQLSDSDAVSRVGRCLRIAALCAGSARRG